MIRIYQRGDHLAVAEIFASAIHEIASAVYTPEQCLAWSARAPNYDHWQKRCELKRPFIATVEGEAAAFLELDPDGHIDCAYVKPTHQRKGLVSRLVEHAVDTCFAIGIQRVYVEASLCAKPMFEKLGFTTICDNLVEIRGVRLQNFKMERRNPNS